MPDTMPSNSKATCMFMHDTTDWCMPVTGVEHAWKKSQNPTMHVISIKPITGLYKLVITVV